MNEVDRIKKAYNKRDSSGKTTNYSLFTPAILFTSQQREKNILKMLSSVNIQDLQSKKIFDLGCGNGIILRDFVRFGAIPENCSGLDLLQDRIDTAKKLSPTMSFMCQNAETLPYDSASFDIVLCFTVFTSIFDHQMQQNLANEMLRVLKPSGIILLYDFLLNNPQNPDVRGLKKKKILTLFPGCNVNLKRVTLAPPLARALARYSWITCYLLEKIKILNTHYIGIIRKKS